MTSGNPEIQAGASGDSRRFDLLIVVVTAGILLGLTLSTRGSLNNGVYLPIQSTNDLSRWATIYSLGERGTYQIDVTPWRNTIDRVQVNGHFYSSKPPLLPTVLAGEYLLLKTLSFGRLNFSDHPVAVMRIILITVNLVPMVVFLLLFSQLLGRLTTDPWVRMYTLLAAGLGTYLTAYSVTLNNHTVAAFSMFFALFAAFLIWQERRREWWLFAAVGFFGAFTAVNELPAAAFLVAVAAGLLWKARRETLLFFLPFAVIPVAAHFGTNYAAVGSLKPAYADKAAYVFPGSYWKIDPATGRLRGSKVDPATGKESIELQKGIDNQYEPWPVYLFHLLLGHHGILSLSPIFLFSLIGLLRRIRARGDPLKPFALLAVSLTLLLFVFYIFFAGQRNYGGVCSGLRWFFWLIPLWLMFLPAGLEGRTASRWVRGLACAFLLISVVTVFYAAPNPWTKSWLHEWLYQIQWVSY
jgi:hypothetical protein